ncbi:MAG TPA: TolC family protein [Longimicrobiales bacterium]|nr:TolC family protein [Longimicrobiales bacterium]
MLSTVFRTGGTAVFLFALATSPARPQAGATLTLPEAITLASRNNPDFLQQANDITVSDWAVRGAYGQLLPGASASTSYSYSAAGEQRIGNFTGSDLGLASTTDYHSSSYSIGMSYRLSGASLLAPGHAKTQRQATAAAIEAADFNLRVSVTRQYIAVKRAQDGVVLAVQELARADDNLKLAQARVQVGAAIPLEAQQAQVERGRAEVALLQAENLVQTERLRLMQLLGVDLPEDVQLTTQFAVGAVPWTQAELLAIAAQTHPSLRAARAQASASEASVQMARAAYLPSLSFSAGVLSGFARRAGNADFLVQQARNGAASQAQTCTLLNQISAGLSSPLPGMPADCSSFTLTAEQENAIRAGNQFDFSREPYSLSMSVSLPLFDGFSRERQVEQARVARADASLRLKSEELRVRTEVATALRNAETGRRSAELEARNAQLAEQQLILARERYRVGAASFIELQEAETIKARADRAYLASLYQFHENLAALEAAVGRSLTEGAEIR